MPFTLQTMIFRYNFISNDVFYSTNSFYKVYLTALKKYQCALLHIICEHLHELYTLNSLFRLKGTDKIYTEGLFKFHSNIYSILFVYELSEYKTLLKLEKRNYRPQSDRQKDPLKTT